MGGEKKVENWDEEVTDKPATKVSSWDEEVIDQPVKKKEPTPEEKGVQSTNGSATVSEQQSKSGAGANLPPITLSEETFQQGQAKGDVLKQPLRDEASYQKGRVESMAASRREEGKKLERDVAQELKDKTAKEKELTLKEKLYNYLKSYVGEQGGDVQVTEQVEDLTPIDPFKNIDLQIQELEPINVREEGVDEGLRQSVLMKNFKLQKAIKKDREEMIPVLQNIKTQSDLNKVFGQTANDINTLSEDLKTGEEKLKQDYERARKVNSGSLAENGFVESFGNGIKQTVEANDIADALYTGNEQRFGELLEQNYVRGFLYGDQKKNALGELLGGQAMPIGAMLTAAVLSGGNPAIAGLAGTGYYARLGAGSEATQVYNEARSQGKTHQEAVSLAIDASKTGFVAGGVEGALGGTFGVGELAKGAMKLSKPAVKAIFAAAADAGVDAGAAVGMQYFKNIEAAKKGIKRDETEGLLEEGAAEAIFGLGFQILSKGAGKLKKTAPKVYNQLITQYGNIRPDIVNGTIDQAIKTGEISEADGQQLKEDLGKSNAAQQKLESVEIPEEKKAEIVQIQTKIDDLEAQKEKASPAVLPAIEKQIEDLSGKLQVEAAIPLTAKEKTELNKLQTAKVENKAYDKDRLKVLEKRQEAAQKAADEKKEAAKKAKEEETIKRQQEEEAAKLQEQKTTDIESQKADIERRRQEELNQQTDAGYSTIALDYLFTGGKDVILSTDYLLQALVGGFTHSAKEINDIRNKYADKLGNIKDDINSNIYNQMMSEIRDVINKNYNNSKATEIFDKILKNATGFISREGNQVSSELDKVNEQNETKINAKYDAELEKLKAETNDKETAERQISSPVGERETTTETVAETPTETVETKVEHDKYEKIKSELPKSEYTTEDDFKNDLENGEWALLTAENSNDTSLSAEENAKRNEQAEQWLIKKGYKPQKVAGKYNRAENSFYVKGMTKADAIAFANIFGQENVATDKGLYYQDGSFEARIKGGESYGASDNYVSAINVNGKPIEFSVEFSKDKTKPTKNEKQVSGNRLFSKPLEVAKTIADRYAEKLGFKRSGFEKITKANFDKERAKRIAKAFDDMQNNPNDPEVKAAYEAMAKETIDQYKEIIKDGYRVEVNNDEPYSSSEEMIEDLRDNKRMKIFSTESAFGDEAITEQQRKENPLLRDSGFKDANGVPLLVNDIFRFVHDYFGHSELGNSFGELGEENAWNVHARMYSPLARRAMTTETRGQNSWVNSSGINKEAFEIRDKARKLREVGEDEAADVLVKEVYDRMKFAEQKVGLLPEEFSKMDDELLGKKEPVKEPQKAEPTEESTIFAEVNKAKGQAGRDKAFAKFKDRAKAEDVWNNFDGYIEKLKQKAKEGKIELKTDC